MITDIELSTALNQSRQTFPHLCSDMSRQVLQTVEKLLAEDRCEQRTRPFGETIRNALNECDIRDNRQAYSSLIGHVFGKRGSYQKRFGRTTRQHEPVNTIESHIDSNGQLAFRI